MQVKLLDSDAELALISPVLLELRPQYNPESLNEQIRKQRALGYQIAYVSDDDQVLCVAGFIIGEKLAWRRHLYVDDLVTRESARSSGAGKLIMDWLKDHALKQGCQQLHLDSGVSRFGAHRFYLREGMFISSHHFAIDLTAGN